MSAQAGNSITLVYGPQGVQQAGGSLVLSYSPPASARRTLSAGVRAPWAASHPRGLELRAPHVPARAIGPSTRAPWGRHQRRHAHEPRAPWGVARRVDVDKAAPWGRFAQRPAHEAVAPWGVARALDVERAAPWGQFARHLLLALHSPTAVGRPADREVAAPWGLYLRLPAVDLRTPWAAPRRVDAERYAPWVRFSKQLAPGWGVVVPDGNPPTDANGTVLVPIRSVYVTINSAILTRLDNGRIIPATDMAMSLDTDSWTWSFSASVPGSALADVLPNVNGDPLIAQAAINGTLFNFALERVSRDRVFNSSQLKVSGRGLGAELEAPYAPQMTFGNTSARTARQLLDDILTFNGVSIGWGVGLWQPTDWLVPAGVFNHSGTYVSALNAVVGAAGAYLQPHDTDRTLDVHLRYPTPAWLWSSVTPDFELPAAVTSQEGFEWVDKPVYNRVFVTGQEHGINGQYTRTGTAGDLVAPLIIDPLITHADAARQRGRAVISDTGRIAMVTLRLPVLEETGIIKPGKFVRYTEGGNTHIGITRGLSVAANLPTIYQTLTVETHVEPI